MAIDSTQSSEVQFVYMTAPDKATACKLGRQLVEQRLVACINVIEPMTSLYWWDGKVQEDNEAVLVAKTRADLMPLLVAHVKAQHPYDCPCVVSTRVVAGSDDYLEWVRAETRPID